MVNCDFWRVFGVVGTFVCASAQADSLSHKQHLFDLSLGELLSISVVSKKTEAISVSPGVVSSFSAQQLQQMGLHSLKDFIQFVPSIEVNERLNGDSLVQVRGLPVNSNQKVLFLVNGVPYWMPENAEFPFDAVPMAAIDKIEVIRGPGAVIYGTNASSGVINIITRQDDGVTLRVFGTDEKLYNTSLYFGEKSGDISVNVSAEIQRDSGYDYAVRKAFDATLASVASGDLVRIEEHRSFLMNWAGSNWSGTFQDFRSTDTGDLNASLVSPTEYRAEGRLLALNYQAELGDSVVKFSSDWNNYYRDVLAEDFLILFGLPGDGGIVFDDSGEGNTRFRNGITWSHEFNDRLSVLAGGEYEERKTENKKFVDEVNGDTLDDLPLPFSFQSDGSILLVENDTAYERSGFVQLDYVQGPMRLVAGARYIDNSISGHDLAPRTSLVYEIDQHMSVKALYSEAFSSPTFSQSSARSNVGLPLNIDVKPETIKTWELSLTHSDRDIYQVLTAFHIEAEDLIFESSNADELVKRQGLEYELKVSKGNTNALGAVTYIRQGDGNSGDEDSLYSARWLFKAGLSHEMGAHDFSASLRSSGKRRDVSEYHWLNVGYGFNFDDTSRIFATVTNVLDDDIEHPSVDNINASVVQATDGIGLLFGLSYSL